MNKIKLHTIFGMILGNAFLCAGPIHDAIKEGHLSEVVRLLDSKESHIEEQDKAGVPPLLCAVFSGRINILKELLCRGANIGSEDYPANAIMETLALNRRRNGYREAMEELQKHVLERKRAVIGAAIEGTTNISAKGLTSLILEYLGEER